MTRPAGYARAALAGLLLALGLGPALVGCGAPGGSDAPPVYRAPAAARAAWALEPPVVAAGEVAMLDLAVVTEPGATLRPFELPDSVPGFYLLEREPVVVVKEPARWIHRTRLRLRAIEVGRFEVAGGEVELESPEGGARTLRYDALPVEVVSVFAQGGRETPYGVRRLAAARDGGAGSVAAFTAGVVLTLASVGTVLLVRRRLARRPDPLAEPSAPDEPPAWERASDSLARAAEMLERDPRRALDGASLALRRYAASRFGGDANVRTTEELRGSQPPFLLTTRWPRFVALLAALDAARFPAPPAPEGPDAEATRRAHALLRDARAFVEESAPREPAP